MTGSEQQDAVRRSATLSPCGRYRYALSRTWGPTDRPTRYAWFVMLNPSTADSEVDDPTVRRCMGFARSWGLDGLYVVNLYALRATDPRDLWASDAAVGEGQINDGMLRLAAGNARTFGDHLVAAWGVNAKPGRVDQVLAIVADAGVSFQALGVTKDGHPRHPLYLPRTAELSPWPADQLPALHLEEAM